MIASAFRGLIGATMLVIASAAAPVSGSPPVMASNPDHPEARPFGHPDRAPRDVAAALERAKTSGHRVILVFGANWCPDSRALAGWFATPRFADMLAPRYEVVWVDVGKKDRNLDLARRFGLDGISGTPTVLVLDSAGKPVNLADAATWHDASARTEEAIYAYFAR